MYIVVKGSKYLVKSETIESTLYQMTMGEFTLFETKEEAEKHLKKSGCNAIPGIKIEEYNKEVHVIE